MIVQTVAKCRQTPLPTVSLKHHGLNKVLAESRMCLWPSCISSSAIDRLLSVSLRRSHLRACVHIAATSVMGLDCKCLCAGAVKILAAVWLSVHQSFCLCACLLIHLSGPSTGPPARPPARPSVRLSVCPSVRLSMLPCLSTRQFAFH